MNEEEELRLRDVEKFVIEARAGRKMLILISSALGAFLTLLGVFWNQIFHGGT